MEQCVKERLLHALKKRNFFHIFKKDSLEILENAPSLCDVYIKVLRRCTVDILLFRYSSRTGTFHRYIRTIQDDELQRRETKYNVPTKGLAMQCFSQQIDVDSFISLLESEFDPLGIFNLM